MLIIWAIIRRIGPHLVLYAIAWQGAIAFRVSASNMSSHYTRVSFCHYSFPSDQCPLSPLSIRSSPREHPSFCMSRAVYAVLLRASALTIVRRHAYLLGDYDLHTQNSTTIIHILVCSVCAPVLQSHVHPFGSLLFSMCHIAAPPYSVPLIDTSTPTQLPPQ